MGLHVAIRDEDGVQQEIVLDEKNLLKRLLGTPVFSELPMLASIDHYGDTTFNRVQIEYFIKEWTDISNRASTDDEKKLFNTVYELADTVRASVHLYLVFIGD